MTDLEKAHKTIRFLKDAVANCKDKMAEMKAECGELRSEIRFMARTKSCPALLEMQQKILALEENVRKYEEFQRNNLVGDAQDGSGH